MGPSGIRVDGERPTHDHLVFAWAADQHRVFTDRTLVRLSGLGRRIRPAGHSRTWASHRYGVRRVGHQDALAPGQLWAARRRLVPGVARSTCRSRCRGDESACEDASTLVVPTNPRRTPSSRHPGPRRRDQHPSDPGDHLPARMRDLAGVIGAVRLRRDFVRKHVVHQGYPPSARPPWRRSPELPPAHVSRRLRYRFGRLRRAPGPSSGRRLAHRSDANTESSTGVRQHPVTAQVTRTWAYPTSGIAAGPKHYLEGDGFGATAAA